MSIGRLHDRSVMGSLFRRGGSWQGVWSCGEPVDIG